MRRRGKLLAAGAALTAIAVALAVPHWRRALFGPAEAEYDGHPTRYWREQILLYHRKDAPNSLWAAIKDWLGLNEAPFRYPPLSDTGPSPVERRPPDPAKLAVLLELTRDQKTTV